MSDLREILGEPISVYTRAQALADGLLVEAGALAREAGFVVPVVLTRAAWVSCVAWPGLLCSRLRVPVIDSCFGSGEYRLGYQLLSRSRSIWWCALARVMLVSW